MKYIQAIFLFALAIGASISAGNVIRDCVDTNVVALTFDDGPTAYTSEILEILNDKNVKATFFALGSRFNESAAFKEAREEVLRLIHSNGHTIANGGMFQGTVDAEEVKEAEDEIYRITGGYKTTLFRPSRGGYSLALDRELIAEGYQTVMYNLDLLDWIDDVLPEHIISLVEGVLGSPLSEVSINDIYNFGLPRRGSFIISGNDSKMKLTLELSSGEKLLARIIDLVNQAGFEFVTMHQCLNGKNGGGAGYGGDGNGGNGNGGNGNGGDGNGGDGNGGDGNGGDGNGGDGNGGDGNGGDGNGEQSAAASNAIFVAFLPLLAALIQ